MRVWSRISLRSSGLRKIQNILNRHRQPAARLPRVGGSCRLRPGLSLRGQTRPYFIDEACIIHAIESYRIILIDCSKDVRTKRLAQRGQPELANEQMMEWGRYLLKETGRIGGHVINNDDLSIADAAAAVERFLEEPGRAARP